MLISMQFTNRLICSLITLIFAFFAGCSSDSNPTGGGGGVTNPIASSFDAATAIVPGPFQAAANANPTSGAALGVSYINRVNSINNFSGWFTGAPTPVRAQNQAMPADADTITYMYGGITVSVIINVDTIVNGGDELYTNWKVILNGSDLFHSYSDFLFIAGNFSEDLGGGAGIARNHNIPGVLPADISSKGSEGSMTVYDFDHLGSSLQESYWNWGFVDFEANYHSQTEQDGYVQMSVNLDGSGILEFRPAILLSSSNGAPNHTYRAVWQADGTGTWTAYSVIGNVDSTGTF